MQNCTQLYKFNVKKQTTYDFFLCIAYICNKVHDRCSLILERKKGQGKSKEICGGTIFTSLSTKKEYQIYSKIEQMNKNYI